jgi:UDP-N-acetylmuramate dehydrogenase
MQTVARMALSKEDRIADELRGQCPRGFRRGEPMKHHTSIGAGGNARYFAVPGSAREVAGLGRSAIKNGIKYIGVGRGSNLLVLDGGYDGLIIKGASFTRLGRIVTRSSRPGFEFAIGIPGSVGGAVRMNAGAFGSELARVVKSVKIIDEEGRIVVMEPEDLAFRYRGSGLPPRAIVLAATFNCPPGEMDETRLERTLDRKVTQPLSERSFGSTFKNPPDGFAAQMIEECGLKGERRGGAMVSEKHSNFMINVGEDTRANDFKDLIEFVIEKVMAKFAVRLEPEVTIIGNR